MMHSTNTPARQLATDAAQRLAKLCGMFGSNHAGERASAAAKANKLVRDQGLTWPEIIASSIKPRSSIAEQIGFAVANIGALSMWERGFLYSINGQRRLSPKKLAVLHEIVAKIQGARP